ncbi:MAG: class I SAM-dependent methyltransferase [Candidatus Nitrosopolaris sp.]
MPFDDRSFDLVLSGHFLFTYAHKFEFPFILSSIKELFRVCSREVRIYPLQKSSFEPYEHMLDLLNTLKKQYGITCDIVEAAGLLSICNAIAIDDFLTYFLS